MGSAGPGCTRASAAGRGWIRVCPAPDGYRGVSDPLPSGLVPGGDAHHRLCMEGSATGVGVCAIIPAWNCLPGTREFPRELNPSGWSLSPWGDGRGPTGGCCLHSHLGRDADPGQAQLDGSELLLGSTLLYKVQGACSPPNINICKVVLSISARQVCATLCRRGGFCSPAVLLSKGL